MWQLRPALTFVLTLSSAGISASLDPNAGSLSARSHDQPVQAHAVAEVRRLEARMNSSGGGEGASTSGRRPVFWVGDSFRVPTAKPASAGTTPSDDRGLGGKAPRPNTSAPKVDPRPQSYHRNKNAASRGAKKKAREAAAAAATASRALLGATSRPPSGNVAQQLQLSRLASTNPLATQLGRPSFSLQLGSAPLEPFPLTSSGSRRVTHPLSPQSASHSIPLKSAPSPRPRRTLSPSPPPPASPPATARDWNFLDPDPHNNV